MNSQSLFTQNIAEISISYSRKVRFADMEKISCSADASELLRRIWSASLDHIEEFYILLISRSNKVLGYYQVSKGGISGTVADPKVIFQVALKASAASIILAHNHPSGNSRPSDSDVNLTKKLREVGSLLEIPVIDHVIMTSESYFSFADEGLL